MRKNTKDILEKLGTCIVTSKCKARLVAVDAVEQKLKRKDQLRAVRIAEIADIDDHHAI